jgi:hypothetical protein
VGESSSDFGDSFGANQLSKPPLLANAFALARSAGCGAGAGGPRRTPRLLSFEPERRGFNVSCLCNNINPKMYSGAGRHPEDLVGSRDRGTALEVSGQPTLLTFNVHVRLVGRQNRSSGRVPVEKASVSYGTDFSIAKQSGGWARSERLGNNAGVVVGDTE